MVDRPPASSSRRRARSATGRSTNSPSGSRSASPPAASKASTTCLAQSSSRREGVNTSCRTDDDFRVAGIHADAQVMRYLGDGRPRTREQTWHSLATHLGHWQLRGYGKWAVVERATARPSSAGAVSLVCRSSAAR
jgi:hypothetical protein